VDAEPLSSNMIGVDVVVVDVNMRHPRRTLDLSRWRRRAAIRSEGRRRATEQFFWLHCRDVIALEMRSVYPVGVVPEARVGFDEGGLSLILLDISACRQAKLVRECSEWRAAESSDR
jgi:hypothetical protein